MFLQCRLHWNLNLEKSKSNISVQRFKFTTAGSYFWRKCYAKPLKYFLVEEFEYGYE